MWWQAHVKVEVQWPWPSNAIALPVSRIRIESLSAGGWARAHAD